MLMSLDGPSRASSPPGAGVELVKQALGPGRGFWPWTYPVAGYTILATTIPPSGPWWTGAALPPVRRGDDELIIFAHVPKRTKFSRPSFDRLREIAEREKSLDDITEQAIQRLEPDPEIAVLNLRFPEHRIEAIPIRTCIQYAPASGGLYCLNGAACGRREPLVQELQPGDAVLVFNRPFDRVCKVRALAAAIGPELVTHPELLQQIARTSGMGAAAAGDRGFLFIVARDGGAAHRRQYR